MKSKFSRRIQVLEGFSFHSDLMTKRGVFMTTSRR